MAALHRWFHGVLPRSLQYRTGRAIGWTATRAPDSAGNVMRSAPSRSVRRHSMRRAA
jgi:hypothetical protein